MDNGHAGYMGAVRWVSFGHHGDPESGEVRTMDDGSVWARISDLDPRGDDDRWVLLLDPAGVEAPGVSEARFHDVTIWIPRVETDSVISVFRYLPVSVPSWLKVLPRAVVGV